MLSLFADIQPFCRKFDASKRLNFKTIQGWSKCVAFFLNRHYLKEYRIPVDIWHDNVNFTFWFDLIFLTPICPPFCRKKGEHTKNFGHHITKPFFPFYFLVQGYGSSALALYYYDQHQRQPALPNDWQRQQRRGGKRGQKLGQAMPSLLSTLHTDEHESKGYDQFQKERAKVSDQISRWQKIIAFLIRTVYGKVQ